MKRPTQITPSRQLYLLQKDHIHLININNRTMSLTCLNIFSSRWNHFIDVLIVTLTVQHRKFVLAFRRLAKFFWALLPQPFPPKESVFSFKLFNNTLVVFPPCMNCSRWREAIFQTNAKNTVGQGSHGAKTTHISLKHNY